MRPTTSACSGWISRSPEALSRAAMYP
jgi:hypothetical protein